MGCELVPGGDGQEGNVAKMTQRCMLYVAGHTGKYDIRRYERPVSGSLSAGDQI